MKQYQADFPWTENKKSFFYSLCPAHEVYTRIGNPLISEQIANSFG